MSKTDDFNTIVLFKNELRCLKSLNKSKTSAVIDPVIMKDLLDYSLIKQVITGHDAYGYPITDGSCLIDTKGERYLVYLKQNAKPSIVEWVRYGITTVIAVAALILSIFF